MRDVLARSYCPQHLARLYQRFDPAVFVPFGMMLPIGPVGVDGTANVACACCAATDTGPAFTTCWWCCRRRHEREVAWQAELTLTPPDVDPDDRNFDNVMCGWADRLVVAVEAGAIDEAVARRAWHRRVGEGVADVAA